MKTFLIALVSITLSVAAQFSLKAGMSGAKVQSAVKQSNLFNAFFNVLTDRYVAGGFILYALGAIVWLAVLSKWDVSKAYPLVGLGFLFTVAIGWLVGEQVTTVRAIGVLLICVGVVLVGRG